MSETILARLGRLHPKIIDLDLRRIQRLLQRLGHPEDHLPPTIHVAGTNGKGSTIAYMRAIAEAAGLTTHVYTSPHLVHFHERICLAGHFISEPDLQAVLEECEAANRDEPITLFEITTAAAFLAFARHQADLLLLETGLGGRLDATNVITRSLASIITPVSIDHEQYLGKGLANIAREKAGIFKAHRPAMIAQQPAEAMYVLKEEAAKKDTPICLYGRDYHIEITPNDWLYRDDKGALNMPWPNLPGSHQIGNAALAIAALRHVEVPIAEKHFQHAITQAQWPARLQRLTYGPLTDILKGHRLWLDGGHNEDAARHISRFFTTPYFMGQKPALIWAMLTTKDPYAFLQHFQGQAACVICVDMPTEHDFFPASELAKMAQSMGLPAQISPNVRDAATRLKDHHGSDILICGSLYLAGYILANHG